MDVDTAAATGATGGGSAQAAAQEKTLKVHPLALIAITDHQTRVVTGNSLASCRRNPLCPLRPNDPNRHLRNANSPPLPTPPPAGR